MQSMAQDFAKHSNARSVKKKRKAPSSATRIQEKGPAPWNWFFSGLVAGTLLTTLVYVIILKPLDQKLIVAEEAPPTPESPAEIEEDTPEFEFYESLREAQVEIDVVQVPITERDIVENDPSQYFLQVGSFQERDMADSVRASILLLNMEARIIPAIIAGDTWHRVQAGPFAGRRAMEAAEDALYENNMNNLIRLKVSEP